MTSCLSSIIYSLRAQLSVKNLLNDVKNDNREQEGAVDLIDGNYFIKSIDKYGVLVLIIVNSLIIIKTNELIKQLDLSDNIIDFNEESIHYINNFNDKKVIDIQISKSQDYISIISKDNDLNYNINVYPIGLLLLKYPLEVSSIYNGFISPHDRINYSIQLLSAWVYDNAINKDALCYLEDSNNVSIIDIFYDKNDKVDVVEEKSYPLDKESIGLCGSPSNPLIAIASNEMDISIYHRNGELLLSKYIFHFEQYVINHFNWVDKSNIIFGIRNSQDEADTSISLLSLDFSNDKVNNIILSYEVDDPVCGETFMKDIDSDVKLAQRYISTFVPQRYAMIITSNRASEFRLVRLLTNNDGSSLSVEEPEDTSGQTLPVDEDYNSSFALDICVTSLCNKSFYLQDSDMTQLHPLIIVFSSFGVLMCVSYIDPSSSYDHYRRTYDPIYNYNHYFDYYTNYTPKHFNKSGIDGDEERDSVDSIASIIIDKIIESNNTDFDAQVETIQKQSIVIDINVDKESTKDILRGFISNNNESPEFETNIFKKMLADNKVDSKIDSKIDIKVDKIYNKFNKDKILTVNDIKLVINNIISQLKIKYQNIDKLYNNTNIMLYEIDKVIKTLSNKIITNHGTLISIDKNITLLYDIINKYVFIQNNQLSSNIINKNELDILYLKDRLDIINKLNKIRDKIYNNSSKSSDDKIVGKIDNDQNSNKVRKINNIKSTNQNKLRNKSNYFQHIIKLTKDNKFIKMSSYDTITTINSKIVKSLAINKKLSSQIVNPLYLHILLSSDFVSKGVNTNCNIDIKTEIYELKEVFKSNSDSIDKASNNSKQINIKADDNHISNRRSRNSVVLNSDKFQLSLSKQESITGLQTLSAVAVVNESNAVSTIENEPPRKEPDSNQPTLNPFFATRSDITSSNQSTISVFAANSDSNANLLPIPLIPSKSDKKSKRPSLSSSNQPPISAFAPKSDSTSNQPPISEIAPKSVNQPVFTPKSDSNSNQPPISALAPKPDISTNQPPILVFAPKSNSISNQPPISAFAPNSDSSFNQPPVSAFAPKPDSSSNQPPIPVFAPKPDSSSNQPPISAKSDSSRNNEHPISAFVSKSESSSNQPPISGFTPKSDSSSNQPPIPVFAPKPDKSSNQPPISAKSDSSSTIVPKSESSSNQPPISAFAPKPDSSSNQPPIPVFAPKPDSFSNQPPISAKSDSSRNNEHPISAFVSKSESSSNQPPAPEFAPKSDSSSNLQPISAFAPKSDSSYNHPPISAFAPKPDSSSNQPPIPVLAPKSDKSSTFVSKSESSSNQPPISGFTPKSDSSSNQPPIPVFAPKSDKSSNQPPVPEFAPKSDSSSNLPPISAFAPKSDSSYNHPPISAFAPKSDSSSNHPPIPVLGPKSNSSSNQPPIPVFAPKSVSSSNQLLMSAVAPMLDSSSNQPPISALALKSDSNSNQLLFAVKSDISSSSLDPKALLLGKEPLDDNLEPFEEDSTFDVSINSISKIALTAPSSSNSAPLFPSSGYLNVSSSNSLFKSQVSTFLSPDKASTNNNSSTFTTGKSSSLFAGSPLTSASTSSTTSQTSVFQKNDSTNKSIFSNNNTIFSNNNTNTNKTTTTTNKTVQSIFQKSDTTSTSLFSKDSSKINSQFGQKSGIGLTAPSTFGSTSSPIASIGSSSFQSPVFGQASNFGLNTTTSSATNFNFSSPEFNNTGFGMIESSTKATQESNANTTSTFGNLSFTSMASSTGFAGISTASNTNIESSINQDKLKSTTFTQFRG